MLILLQVLSKAIGLDANKVKIKMSNNNVETVSLTERKGVSDDHNEVCEVCEKGGELLCCDTCSLVFHLQCIRPKLSTVPKGRWSCPHCIVDVSFLSL